MNEKQFSEIGGRLKEEREIRGLNKSQMATLAECANSTYTNYEEGIREPGSMFLLTIAKNANIDILYVLTGLRTDNTPQTNQEASVLQCFRVLNEREQLGVNRLLSTMAGILD